MSRTDISPPIQASIAGTRTSLVQSYNPITKVWGGTSKTVSTTLAKTSAIARSSASTPGYRAAAASGHLPENPFTFTTSEESYPEGTLSYQTALTRSSQSGFFPEATLPLPAYQTISSIRQFNLVNQCKQKLSAKIKDVDVDLAVAYAERERTFKMLAEAVTKLRHAYSAAKRGRWGDALAALGVSPSSRNGSLVDRGNIARGWLEIQYGWRPLLSDIYGLAQAVQKQAQHREYMVVSKKQEILETLSWMTPNGDYLDYTDVSTTFTVRARIKMRSTTMALHDAASLGLTNPAMVAWELVPFSFVVDWALPIGSFISQIDASLGWQFIGGSYTTAMKKFGYRKRVSARPAGFVYHYADISCRNHSFTVQRTGIGSFGDLLTVPYVKDPSSMEHALNALALLNSKR